MLGSARVSKPKRKHTESLQINESSLNNSTLVLDIADLIPKSPPVVELSIFGENSWDSDSSICLANEDCNNRVNKSSTRSIDEEISRTTCLDTDNSATDKKKPDTSELLLYVPEETMSKNVKKRSLGTWKFDVNKRKR